MTDPNANATAAMSKAEAKAAADKAAKEAASNLSNKRFQQTQAQVDEVVDIMRMNVDKVLERDQKLSQLDDRADALQMGASQFEQSAGSLKRKMAWQNMKMMILMGVVGTIMGAVVIFWIYTKVNPEGAAAMNPLAPAAPVAPAVEAAPAPAAAATFAPAAAPESRLSP